MTQATLLSDFLTALGVPHTQRYADQRFNAMTFQSLFGLSEELKNFGIASEGYQIVDKAADLPKLTTPFLAATREGGIVIVENVSPDKVDIRSYDGPKSMSTEQFVDVWTGVVLLAYPAENACEPELDEHRWIDFGLRARSWLLVAACAFIFVYLFIAHGLWQHFSTIALTAISLVGLYVTLQLEFKSLGVHSSTADSICGFIDRTGCSSILRTSASSFFGIVHWSEVGLGYFAVTLGMLLCAPEYIGSLALLNALCCPFSIWSVWYQKFRAKKWCTLCLITQACLWLSLACYIFGGWYSDIRIDMSLFVIGAAYVGAVFGINALSNILHEKA